MPRYRQKGFRGNIQTIKKMGAKTDRHIYIYEDAHLNYPLMSSKMVSNDFNYTTGTNGLAAKTPHIVTSSTPSLYNRHAQHKAHPDTPLQ